MVNSKIVTKGKIALIKYQIYLGTSLQRRMTKYLKDNFTSEDKVYSATFRKALEEFLEKRGY